MPLYHQLCALLSFPAALPCCAALICSLAVLPCWSALLLCLPRPLPATFSLAPISHGLREGTEPALDAKERTRLWSGIPSNEGSLVLLGTAKMPLWGIPTNTSRIR